MIKTVGIVSLSSGILGEAFVRHELDIGVRRLEAMGLSVRFLPHALKGMEHVKAHPEDRAADLLQAFRDPQIDLILCAIGGDDTYRLLPYLFGHGDLAAAVCDKPFLGFSDTTINHFMLHKLGLPTFYGQSFLPDVCELEADMLPYTRRYFEELIATGTIRRVTPSDVWYAERTSYGADQVGVARISHPDRGFVLLQGAPVFSGEILGGCIDSMFEMFDPCRYADMPELCSRYALFPSEADWRGRILLLETSEEKMSPEQFRRALELLKAHGVFRAVSGVLFGKPIDGLYEQEYWRALVEVIDDPTLPIVCNLKVGHALPRCIVPFGVPAVVDTERQEIRFT
ncbi:MAG: LD-carboxypeptidase [Oscillospiraceae bacterium]|nr:LD-carboxypeptidase [Oscillospiraceae bacterium]